MPKLKRKKFFILPKLLMAFFLFLLTPSKAYAAEVYGNPWNCNGLANLEVGGTAEGREVAYRFKAQYTGTVESVRIYFETESGGYGAGNGGIIRTELRTDDGTSNHFPGGTVLDSYDLVEPRTGGAIFPEIPFNNHPRLEEGKLYHLEFSNIASDPISNFVSTDDLSQFENNSTSNIQPTVSDIDLATLWKPSANSSWEFNYRHTPVFSLSYTNGEVQGIGYIDCICESGVRTISGGSKVRETFTVSGGDKTVSDINVRIKKRSNSGGLIVKLEHSNGSIIEQGTIPASEITTISDWMDWATFQFTTEHRLSSGESYNLELSSPDGSYTTFGAQEGVNWGFDPKTVFADGKMQYSTGGSWITHRSDQMDMQFYFTLSDGGATPTPGSPTPTPTSTPLPSPYDLDGNSQVNAADVLILLQNWRNGSQGDFNSDGKVNSLDFGLLIANWGT